MPELWPDVLDGLKAATGSAAGVLMLYEETRPIGFKGVGSTKDVAWREGGPDMRTYALSVALGTILGYFVAGRIFGNPALWLAIGAGLGAGWANLRRRHSA